MILYQKFINRIDLQRNPQVMYLFGDNTLRRGMGGQAKEMRGEPNAVGVATKKLPSQMENSYFSDDHFNEYMLTMWIDLRPAYIRIVNDGTLIIPTDGLGTGLSKLPELAPRLNAALLIMLKILSDIDELADVEDRMSNFIALEERYINHFKEYGIKI
tara:strand:- start:1929 stop:2402 length:474 start_codon:yes stop_codon:yes gene_type:complete